MNVKQCRNRPDVVGEAGGHGRWAAMALGVGQGVVGRTEVVHRADQVHAQGHHAVAPGAIAGTPLHLQETFSDVVKTDKTGLSKTAHTRWMISAFANFLPGSTIFRLA